MKSQVFFSITAAVAEKYVLTLGHNLHVAGMAGITHEPQWPFDLHISHRKIASVFGDLAHYMHSNRHYHRISTQTVEYPSLTFIF